MVKKSVCIISILCLIGIAGLALNASDALAKTQFISIGTGGYRRRILSLWRRSC